jgi:tetratricopeptide (TPR) repeat protein
MNIGSINYRTGYNDLAQSYYSQSLELIFELGDTISAASAFANLGLTYVQMDNLSIAKEYLMKSININKKYNSTTQAALTFSYLAQAEKKSNNYEKSLAYLDSALIYVEKEDHIFEGPRQSTMTNIISELGQVHFFLGNYEDALSYLRRTIEISKVHHQLTLLQQANKYLSMYWERFGEIDSSLYYYKLYKSYSDTINDQDNMRQLSYQQAKFQFEQEMAGEKLRKENELQIQKRNALILVFVIVGLLLALAILFLYLKLLKNKQKNSLLKQESLEKELELRNKELATHVIYRLKNNEFILEIVNNLKKSIPKLKPENKKIIEDVIRKIEIDPHDETWKEFEVRFQNVHTGFYKNLADKYPDLSPTDLKLAAFMKLNMSFSTTSNNNLSFLLNLNKPNLIRLYGYLSKICPQ